MMARRRARPSELADLIQGEQTDAVRGLEDRITDAALGDSEQQFTELQQRTLTAWTTAFGSPQQKGADGGVLHRLLAAVRAAVQRILGTLEPRAQRALDEKLQEAIELGARQHATYLAEATAGRARPVNARVTRRLRETAARLSGVVAERRDRAVALLQPAVASRWSRVTTGIGVARSALGAVRSHITWTVGQAVNDGLTAGVQDVGARKLWVSERDACVSCTAYSGMTVDADADFPGGLSWDPNQRGRTQPLAAPPRHPHCRCRVVAWSDEWAVDGVPSMPQALRREARRSIARGWSLPTESGAARIRAARELLRTGAGLPKSVEEFAALAIRNGRFTDRNVPTSP